MRLVYNPNIKNTKYNYQNNMILNNKIKNKIK